MTSLAPDLIKGRYFVGSVYFPDTVVYVAILPNILGTNLLVSPQVLYLLKSFNVSWIYPPPPQKKKNLLGYQKLEFNALNRQISSIYDVWNVYTDRH